MGTLYGVEGVEGVREGEGMGVKAVEGVGVEDEGVGVEDECQGITLDMLNLAKAILNIKANSLISMNLFYNTLS